MSYRKACIAFTAALLACTAAKADIRSTIQGARSGTTVTVSGTYTVSGGKITVPSGVTVKGTATFNFTSHTSDGFYVKSGSSHVVLQGFTVAGANHGIIIYGNHCTVNGCLAQNNNNTGIELIGSGAFNNLVENCTSQFNADTAASGGNADGFGCKQGTQGGNVFTHITAHDNSDDGFDCEKSSQPVTVTNSTSYNNGFAHGLVGNGNGWKMGIGGDNVAHIFTNDNAHNNTRGDSAHGFAANHNTGRIRLTTCHSYSNKNKDDLGNSILTNCTMQK